MGKAASWPKLKKTIKTDIKNFSLVVKYSLDKVGMQFSRSVGDIISVTAQNAQVFDWIQSSP